MIRKRQVRWLAIREYRRPSQSTDLINDFFRVASVGILYLEFHELMNC